MLPLETNIKEAYQAGTDDEQNFIQNLSLFLCTFLKEHAQLVEKKNDLHSLLMEVSLCNKNICKNQFFKDTDFSNLKIFLLYILVKYFLKL